MTRRTVVTVLLAMVGEECSESEGETGQEDNNEAIASQLCGELISMLLVVAYL